MIKTIEQLIDFLEASPGTPLDLNAVISDYSMRAWDVKKNSVFIPFTPVGEPMYQRAVNKGAIACLYDDPGMNPPNGILVDDVNKAARRLAEAGRSEFGGKVIGVTGSAGKSSVKSMLVAAFSGAGTTQSAFKNQNLPEYVVAQAAGLDAGASFYVAELALRHQEAVAESADIMVPDVAIVTNISSNHAENFNDKSPIHDQILQAKCKIFDPMRNGVAVLPSGSPHFDKLLAEAHSRPGVQTVITCGTRPDDTVQLLSCEQSLDTSKVTVACGDEEIAYLVPLPGIHMVENSLLVVGALAACSLPLSLMQRISSMAMPHSASKRYSAAYFGITVEVVAEVFNMGADNFNALMHRIRERNDPGRKILVMCDCRETGELSEEIHSGFGKEILKTGFDHLITVGKESKKMAQDLPISSSQCSDVEQAYAAIRSSMQNNDLLVVKGTQSMGFPAIINKLQNDTDLRPARSDWQRGKPLVKWQETLRNPNYCVKRIGQEDYLASSNTAVSINPASTLKVLEAVVAIDLVRNNAVKLSDRFDLSIRLAESNATTVESFTLQDLLLNSLMASSNRAASRLGLALGELLSSKKTTVANARALMIRAMQQKAQTWGLQNTVITTLDGAEQGFSKGRRGQRSNVEDLAKIVENVCLGYPEIMNFMSIGKCDVPSVDDTQIRSIESMSPNVKYFDGLVGEKGGQTSQASVCGYFRFRNDIFVYAVGGLWGNAEGKEARWADSQKIIHAIISGEIQ